MRNIIFVTGLELWSMGKGKGGPAFSNTIDAYVKNDWNVWLVSDCSQNKDFSKLDQKHNIIVKPSFFKKFISIRKLGLIFRILNHLVISIKFKKEIIKILSQVDYNTTVLYAYEIFGVKSCSTLSKKYKIPLVTRFQGTILSQYNKLKGINKIRLYPHIQALSTTADLIIMTNDGTQGKKVLQELGNNSKTLFLLNGLDLLDMDVEKLKASFNRKDFREELSPSLMDSDLLFLTASRLEGWKRLDRAIDGFAEFCKKNASGLLVIVGDGSARKDLEERVINYKLQKRILFVGSVAHSKIYDYMMASDVFVSLYDLSNVGNPLLEAMTLGKCIITYDVGDTREFIQNNTNGILLSKEEIPSLCEKMLMLASDRSLIDKYGKQARNFSKEHFYNWTVRMRAELSEIEKLLENAKKDFPV